MSVYLETLSTLEITAGPDGHVGQVITGQEGEPATVKLNGAAIVYPATLKAGDVLRLERRDGDATTRLLGPGMVRLSEQLEQVPGGMTELDRSTATTDQGGMMMLMPTKAGSVTAFAVRVGAQTGARGMTLRYADSAGHDVTMNGMVSGEWMLFRLPEKYQTLQNYPVQLYLSAGWEVRYLPTANAATSGPKIGDLVYYQGYLSQAGQIDSSKPAEFALRVYSDYESVVTGPRDVVGPLAPDLFPISTVAAAPKNSGFMIVDDVAKTATLAWKFSDGSVKGVELATVIQAAPAYGGESGLTVTATLLDRTASEAYFWVPAGTDATLYTWTLTAGGQTTTLQSVTYQGDYEGAPYYSGSTNGLNLASYGPNDIVIKGKPK